ncbi:MAG: flagellar hook-associated protein FlgK [Bdellovibrionales bacterium]|nr:flagellar hook-associated protein FlgK [Bdellovibrionales bacterium]
MPNIMQTGKSGLMTSKAAIGTTGHNISNANTEGFSRQRVDQATTTPHPRAGEKRVIGTGTKIDRVRRINDEYLEKQIRSSHRLLNHFEEKDMMLKQVEDIFNEMNGDGLNRLMSRYFNEFRKLANEPDNEAVRQSVREATQSMVNDFHRIRNEVVSTSRHIDSRLEGYISELNNYADQMRTLNRRIREVELGNGSPNDLYDRRDEILKKISSYLDITTHKDNHGNVNIDIQGVGPLVTGDAFEQFSTERSPMDDQGKMDGSVDIRTSGSVRGIVTHNIKGGKLGALLEVRDQAITQVLNRMDELAYNIAESTNAIHEQGFTRDGVQGVKFFKQLDGKNRAAELLELSDEVKYNSNAIATAAAPDAPGDNRIALLVSGLQHHRIMNDGKVTADDFYNSIVSDVGVSSSRNRENLGQQKEIQTQLGKMRDSISGVSLDEETTNLMQYQHIYGASAKVIQVADEMLKTVLELKRN